ncbi:MAG: GAF domain-containing protein [Magnetococcales bacterium]|nr:GAF domain-containing protein [Magnetococcales bacterium]
MRWKVTGLLLVIGLVPLGLAVWFAGVRAGDALMDKAADQLRTVRQIKKHQVEALFASRRQDVSMLVDTVGTLRSEAFRKLTALREDRKLAVSRYLRTIESEIATLAAQPMVIEAAQGFRRHLPSLRRENGVEGQTLERMRGELAAHYAGEFRQEYRRRNAGREPEQERWFAALDDDAVALQAYYVMGNPNAPGARHRLDRHADDRSAYGQLHARIHPVFRNYLDKLGYHDILIADPESGRIVYSTVKEVDLGRSLKEGAIAGSNLALAFRQASREEHDGAVVAADVAPYWPSYLDPAGFLAVPILDGTRTVGILLFQFPLDALNAIMTERAGQGASGQTYLVGQDRLMRSDAFLDPEHRSVAASLRQPEQGRVDTEAVRSALAGETGTRVIRDYRGNPVLAAWTPLVAMGLHWALVAEVSVGEAFIPMDDQGRSFLARYAEKHGYRDLLLIDPDGYVFHSVARTPVLGSNLLDGSYADSHLSDLVRRILATGGIGFADLAPYAPRDGQPAFFVAQAAGYHGKPEVIVALEMPLEGIDRIIHQREGMGRTGETFLVGRHQGRISYRNNRVVEPARVGDSDADASGYGERALNGETGSMLGICRDGASELVDFAPLDIPGLNWAIVSLMRVDEVRAPVHELSLALLLAGCALAGMIVLISWRMARGLVRPMLELQKAATAIAAGDLGARSLVSGQDEVGQVGVTFDRMAHTIEEQHWINAGLARIIGILQQAEHPDPLADALLRELLPMLSAAHGMFFAWDPVREWYEPLGNFRHALREDHRETVFVPGEGLVGRCALTGRTEGLDNIPAEAARIGFGLGEALPVSVIAVPVVHRERVSAVLVLAALRVFTPVQRELLEAVAQRLGPTLSQQWQAMETRELLEETRRQAEELQVQTEELEIQQDELRQINDALKSSEVELKTRQEALQAANAALTEQARHLEERTLELEAARHALERTGRDHANPQSGDLTLLVIENHPASVGREQMEQVFQRIAQAHGDKPEHRRLLLVDDDPVTRTLIAYRLAAANCQVREASRGEEALDLLRREVFDCMILDLGLPDMTGFGILDRLAADRTIRKPPVVVYSGRELTRLEYDYLQRYTDSIVIKGEHSAERLLEEVTLLPHREAGDLREGEG